MPKAPRFPRGVRPVDIPDAEAASIRTQAEVHDSYVIELKVHSGLTRPAAGAAEDVRYRLEAWLHVPMNFGVTKKSYPAGRFFGQSRALLRRDPPSLWVRDAHERITPRIDRALLDAIRATFDRYLSEGRTLHDEHARHVLLFGSSLRRSVKEVRRLLKLGSDLPSEPQPVLERMANVPLFIEALEAVYREFRTFRRRLRYQPADVSPAVMDAVLTVDEAASYLLEDALARLDRRLERIERRLGEHADVLQASEHLHQRFRASVRTELAYRARSGFCVHGVSPTGREYFLYRVGQLKKAIDSALYFDIRTRETKSRVKHVVGAIGAAMAAAFAFFSDPRSPVAQFTGVSTALLFTIAVVAYILKDRIKDLTKEVLGGWWTRRMPDRKSAFEHTAMLGAARLRGTLAETAGWSTSADTPTPVQKLRDADHVVDVVEDRREHVLSYAKTVTYRIEQGSERTRGVDLQANLVKDLFRFSVRGFLHNLDDPTRRVSFYDAELDSFVDEHAPKVYHLNLVLAYRTLDTEEENPMRAEVLDTTWERFRVILTRNGIVRLETVLQRGHHDWILGSGQEVDDG